ncbi:MAG: FAD-dependent oxidoreductase [Gemmatimonadales bacterium]
MRQLFGRRRMWRSHELAPKYDVVIIGGGVHGLATAYYLAKLGVARIAVLEMNYIGSGGSGRNTAIIRGNYRTPEGVPFYARSVQMYERLGEELDYNLLFSQQGHLTLAHAEAAVTGLRIRAEVNQLMGVDSRLVWPEEIGRMVPGLDLSDHPRYPIMAALYHPPGGIIRHDAVVWGYARAADRRGVHIHPFTRVTGIRRDGKRIAAVSTTRGEIRTDVVINCTAGYSSTIARMVDVDLPIASHPLHALVTEPLKPFLHKIIVSATLHVYVSQTDRGELVIGAEVDPYTSYSTRASLGFLESAAQHTLELFPSLARVRVLRQWAGVCDMTPDFSPIIGPVPERPGFFLDVGWGTWGFKAAPVAGLMTAECVARGEVPSLVRPFALDRFYHDRLVGEKAAAAVSH